MMRKIVTLLFGLMSTAVLAQPVVTPPVFIPQPASGTLFVPPTFAGVQDPIHYMAPASAGGSDSNDGLAPTVGGGHGPWLTPNHSLNCGDPIAAVTGVYSGAGFALTATNTNCPSTSGGIDGNGGVWFVPIICIGPDLVSCEIPCTAGGWAFDVRSNNWAIENWYIHRTSGTGRCGIVADGAAAGVHHVAAVNNNISNVGIAYGGLDNGLAHDIPGVTGFDYVYYIGNIGQNGEQDTVCTAAMSLAGPNSIDSVAVTHFMYYANYVFNQPSNGCVSDEENYMFDTWDAHGVTNQSVMLNNIGYYAWRFGIQIFLQNFNNVAALHHYVLNNTEWSDNQSNIGGNGAVNIQMNNSGAVSITVLRNIGVVVQPNGCGGLAGAGGGAPGNIVMGTTGNENVFNASTSAQRECVFNGVAAGTNFLQDPLFTNTTDLVNNHLGAPNCTGVPTTVRCMGFNPNNPVSGSNPAPLSVISDLTPTCSNCAGKGYQLPSTTCVTSGPVFTYFPNVMKAMVNLRWNPSTSQIFQYHDVATTPCGL